MENEKETPAKKLKLSTSEDPFGSLHSDVFEYIFQHLKNEDVINSSQVSKLWFDATEKSARCAEKLHLRIVVPYSGTLDEKFASVSKDLISKRKYQNIYIHNFRDILGEIIKVLTGRCWKKVYISVRNLRTRNDFRDIMKLIEPTVENLSISLTSLENGTSIEPLHMKFPKLKILDMHRSNGLLMEEMSEDCTTLKILKVDLDAGSWSKHQSYLRKILANNEGLQRLTLWRCSANHMFQAESIENYRFKLESFSFKNNAQDAPTAEEENHLYDFLESQADSLKSLRLEEWFGIKVLKLIFQMPKLEEVTIDFYDAGKTIDWDALQLEESLTVRKFHLDSYRNNRGKIKMFNALFSAMPNLKFLSIDYLDNETLQSIGLRCQKIEELETQDLRATHVEDPIFFPNIKRFHCEDRIKMKIKQRINIKSFQQRTAFEQLILTAVPYFVTK